MPDPLSDVLELLEATSFVSTSLKAGGAWSVHVGGHEGLKFNAVVTGSAWLSITGCAEPIRLEPGDCFLLARGLPFTLASDLSLAPVDAGVVFGAASGAVAILGDGEGFYVAGGKMTLDPSSASLLTDTLPDYILLPASSERAQTMQWLLARFVAELAADDAGAATVAANLIHMMFVELIRTHLAAVPDGGRGWLSALGDPRIGRTLRLMHDAPTHGWTLGKLADAAAMSRSSFAHHFRARVGVAPLDYLLRWRMQLARRDLVRSAEPIAQVAQRYIGKRVRQRVQACSRHLAKAIGPTGSFRPGRTFTGASLKVDSRRTGCGRLLRSADCLSAAIQFLNHPSHVEPERGLQ